MEYKISGKLIVRQESDGKISFLGLDSEDGGRSSQNLLLSPIAIQGIFKDTEEAAVCFDAELFMENEQIILSVSNTGKQEVCDMSIVLEFDPLYAAISLFSSSKEYRHKLPSPWLVVAPDYGHFKIEAVGGGDWTATLRGWRGGADRHASPDGYDILLRGDDLIAATGLKNNYYKGALRLELCSKSGLQGGDSMRFSLSVPKWKKPDGIADADWGKIRRACLCLWQPCSTWAGESKTHILANNVLSDPASCSLWYYSALMHFVREAVEGFDVTGLLKHSLEYYANNFINPTGTMNAFGRHDIYVCTNAHFLVAAWDYFCISGDAGWFETNIDKLNIAADYLLRRDIDGDGIIESLGSGNAYSLRHPDRADVWWEMINFNWKNTWTNIHAYRAFLCFSEILEACGRHKAAQRYKTAAAKIKKEFFPLFYNADTGMIASWISLDGEMHDYGYICINSLAVAYGLAPKEKQAAIMDALLYKLEKTGYCAYHLGVPLNLVPIPLRDRIQPDIDAHGEPNPEITALHKIAGEDGIGDFGEIVYNGSISPCQTWPFILALQIVGYHGKADMILEKMLDTAQKGGFQNGILNIGYAGAEHLRWDGKTCGYEGYLADMWVFLCGVFTRDKSMQKRFLGPVWHDE